MKIFIKIQNLMIIFTATISRNIYIGMRVTFFFRKIVKPTRLGPRKDQGGGRHNFVGGS